jgi:DNA-binding XRE family transcriptional regulator
VELFLQYLPLFPVRGKYLDLRRSRILSAYMNPLKTYREKLFLSKAELARKAGISTLTIDRVEKGKSCRLETKRKIILALGLTLSEGQKIFGNGR